MALMIDRGQYEKIRTARDAAKSKRTLYGFTCESIKLGRALVGAYYPKRPAEVFGAAIAVAKSLRLKLHTIDENSRRITATAGLGWTRDCLVGVVVEEYENASWVEIQSTSCGIEYLDFGRNKRIARRMLRELAVALYVA